MYDATVYKVSVYLLVTAHNAKTNNTNMYIPYPGKLLF